MGAIEEQSTRVLGRSVRDVIITNSSELLHIEAQEHVARQRRHLSWALAGAIVRLHRPASTVIPAVAVRPSLVIGIAGDSGVGKSTLTRRMIGILSGDPHYELASEGGSNTLIGKGVTVICLDDYHAYDRAGRKKHNITALHCDCQRFDKMAADVAALRGGAAVRKPIYNHVTGSLEEEELVKPTRVLVLEGLHPWYDERVAACLDVKIYVDVTDAIKTRWKAQRDMADRGASLAEVQATISARRPDFAAFVEPQRQTADMVVRVAEAAPSAVACRTEAPVVSVSLIQPFDAAHLSLTSPCKLDGDALHAAWPHAQTMRFETPPTVDWYGRAARVIEATGACERLCEAATSGIVARCLSDAGTAHADELSAHLALYKAAPGSTDASCLFQTLCALKCRELCLQHEAKNTTSP